MDDRQEQRRAQRETLEELALGQSMGPRELDAVMRDITAASARCLQVERVSVWSYTPDRDGITCGPTTRDRDSGPTCPAQQRAAAGAPVGSRHPRDIGCRTMPMEDYRQSLRQIETRMNQLKVSL